MAAPTGRSSVRIRVAEITLDQPENHVIQPFWHLVDLDFCPLVSHVEEKIVSIINSMLMSRSRSRSTYHVPRPANVISAIKSRSKSEASIRSNNSCNEQNTSRSSSNKKEIGNCFVSHESSKAIGGHGNEISSSKRLNLDLKQPEQLAVSMENKSFRLRPTEDESSAAWTSSSEIEDKRAKILSCQLWMDGYLLLSNEKSAIFHDGDLVSLRCLCWCPNNCMSSLNVEHATSDDFATKSARKEKKKKRKHHESVNLTQSFADANETIQISDGVFENNRLVDEISGIPEKLNGDNTLDSSDTPPKKRFKKKEKKDTEKELEHKILSLGQGKSKVDPIDHSNENGNNQALMNSKAEHIIHANDDIAENNSDLFKLLQQKFQELSGKQMNSDAEVLNASGDQNSLRNDVSFNEPEKLELPDAPKRKRRRKRKKKADEGFMTETQLKVKNCEDNHRPKSSTLKLLSGHQPENVRFTFASDNEDDEVANNETIDDNCIKGDKEGKFIASTPSVSIQNKESAIRAKHVTATTIMMKTNRVSSPSTHAVISSSPEKTQTAPFAQGQSLDPNSKFDELLQRRRLSGNNCSVNSLTRGGYIFTRKKQKGRNQYEQSADLPTYNVISTSPAQETLLHSQEESMLVSVPKKESSNNPQASCSTSLIPPEMPLHLMSNKVEVTPLYLDVDRCKPLEGAPQSGDIIAYKILELSDDYTPVLSSFKQGQVISCEGSMVYIELMENSAPTKRTGRFEMSFEGQEEEAEDGKSCDNFVSIELGDMVDTRLVQRTSQKTGQKILCN